MFDDNDDNDEFQQLGDILNTEFKRIQRLMFINDIERGVNAEIPLTPLEYESIFGELEYEDFQILTKLIIKDIKDIKSRTQLRKNKIFNKWGDWITYLLEKNVEYEEYEKCVTFRDAIQEKTKNKEKI